MTKDHSGQLNVNLKEALRNAHRELKKKAEENKTHAERIMGNHSSPEEADQKPLALGRHPVGHV